MALATAPYTICTIKGADMILNDINIVINQPINMTSHITNEGNLI